MFPTWEKDLRKNLEVGGGAHLQSKHLEGTGWQIFAFESSLVDRGNPRSAQLTQVTLQNRKLVSI